MLATFSQSIIVHTIDNTGQKTIVCMVQGACTKGLHKW